MENNKPSSIGKMNNVSLPEELVSSEILIKVPVKSLMQFKCVNKAWNATISSREFAKSHLQKSIADLPPGIIDNILVHSNFALEMHNVEEEGSGESGSFENSDFVGAGANSIQILGSCNGLVCYFVEKTYHYCIWNPCIDEFVSVAFPQTLFLGETVTSPELDEPCSPDERKPFHCCAVGFGYVSGEDDYKIFLAGYFRQPLKDFVLVYSLRTNTWRKLTNYSDHLVDLSLCADNNKLGVLVGETLYWSITYGIIGFNLGRETCHAVTTGAWSESFVFKDICVLGGSLCAWGYNRECSDVFEVWKFDDQLDDSSNWMKLLNINTAIETLYGFTKSGKVIVRLQPPKFGVVLVDPNQIPPDFVHFKHTIDRKLISFRASLISPLQLQHDGQNENQISGLGQESLLDA